MAEAVAFGLLVAWAGSLIWLSGTFLRDILNKRKVSEKRLWLVAGYAVAAIPFLRLIHLLLGT